MKLGEAMYKQQQAEEPQPTQEEQPQQQEEKVVDADFEEV